MVILLVCSTRVAERKGRNRWRWLDIWSTSPF